MISCLTLYNIYMKVHFWSCSFGTLKPFHVPVVICPPLGPHPPCSTDFAVHLSFDYAQQVHLPSFQMQPGPLYFLVPRKVGIFGVCREGIPRHVNHLIDESHCSSKGSNAVISYLHCYFENYWLGEKDVHLHCDNCSGQNKNRYVLANLMWRVLTGRHKSISLNFLITGHTKFAPDWCFGLLKQKFRKEPVSSLKEMEATVCCSTLQDVNVPHLVVDEGGTVFVPKYDWQAFLVPFSKPVKGIKQYHHFSFSHQAMGVVIATTHAEGPTQILPVLVGDAGVVPHAPPPRSSLLASQPNANGTSLRTSVTSAQTTPRTQCVPNPQCLSLAPHHQQDTGKNHFLRVSQILKVVVMPLPEAGVVVGAGVMVVVVVGQRTGVRMEERGRCTK